MILINNIICAASLLVWVIYMLRYVSFHKKKIVVFVGVVLLMLLPIISPKLLIIEWYVTLVFLLLLICYFIVYSWFSLSKLRNRNSSSEVDCFPTVTVALATHNEEEVIESTIHNLLKLNYDPDKLEILVVDDHSDDSTYERLRKFEAYIKIIRRTSGPRGKASAFNEVVPLITSDLICVIDADSILEKDFLLKAVSFFEDIQVGLVQARNIQYNEEKNIITKTLALDIDANYFSITWGKYLSGGMPTFDGRAGIFRRSIFLELNGFDPDLPSEDWDFGFRLQEAGYKLIPIPNVINREQANETVKEWLKQRYRWLSDTVMVPFKLGKSILLSEKLSIWKKIDFQFYVILMFVNLTFNWHCWLNVIDFYQNGGLDHSLYLTLYTFIGGVHLMPKLIIERKWRDWIYIPVMMIYYWFFTLFYMKIIADQFTSRRYVPLQKANHTSESLKKIDACNPSSSLVA